MFNKHNLSKNSFMLNGSFKRKGYDWWWHSFTAYDEFGNEVPFFFEFFITNPKYKELDLGLKTHKPSFLMVKFGHWGKDHIELNYFLPLKDVYIKKGKDFYVKTDNLFLSEIESKGSFMIDENNIGYINGMSDLGSVSWNIEIDKTIAWNVGYGTSSLFRLIKAFQMYWHAEGMKTLFSGEIILNNKKYTIIKDKSYGYADKNWGRGFTSPWVWLSSNNLYSINRNKKLENSVFDIGGGRPKIYCLALNRKLLSGFYIEGKEYEFNFSKFWTKSRTEFDFKEDDKKVYWYVCQKNRKYYYVANFSCEKDNMIKVRYIDPKGNIKFHNLWNGGNGKGNFKIYKKKNNVLIEDIDVMNLGCEYGEFSK